MTAKTETTLPLKVATRRASAELEGLYVRLERLEHGLDTVIVNATHTFDSTSIGMLQELDMLRQSIGALADYLEQISVGTDDKGMVDVVQALSDVPLRDMATRLSGTANSATSVGHAELF